MLVTSMFESAVNAPLVPPVIRSSLIDKVIWSLVVTLAPTWNTPPPVVVVVAEVAVTNGMLRTDRGGRQLGAGGRAVADELDRPGAAAEVTDVGRDTAGEARRYR